MRISTSQLFQQGLQTIQRQQVEITDSQIRVATGKRMLSAADDPAAAAQALGLNRALALNHQYQRNANAATGRLVLEDSVLDGVVDLLQRVRELAVQGNNATLTDPDRQAIAREVEQRLEELLGLANTQDGNQEYLFAGYSTRTQPFTKSGGGFSYNGDQGQRELQIAPGYSVAVGDPGSAAFQAIRDGNGVFATRDDPANVGSGIIDTGSVASAAAFVPDTYTIAFVSGSAYEVRDGNSVLLASGPYTSGQAISFAGIRTAVTGAPAAGDSFTISPSANQDVFTTVQGMISALGISGSDTASSTRRNNAMNRFLSDVDQAMENLLRVRAGVGARLNAIENETAVNEDFEIHLQQMLSDIRDIDLTEAISRLNQQLGSLEAAHRSFLLVQNQSLFNFL